METIARDWVWNGHSTCRQDVGGLSLFIYRGIAKRAIVIPRSDDHRLEQYL